MLKKVSHRLIRVNSHANTDEFDIDEETVDSEDDADDKYGFEEVVVPDEEDSLSGADRLMAELEPDDKDYEDDTDEHS